MDSIELIDSSEQLPVKKKPVVEVIDYTSDAMRIQIIKSVTPTLLYGRGSFRLAHFVFPSPKNGRYYHVQGFRRALTSKVVCFVLDNSTNDLNLNWKLAQPYRFNVLRIKDYKVVQGWYSNIRTSGLCISPFFSES